MGLRTKRAVIGQMIVCSGFCCGAIHRGKPEVPLEWLKAEWRSRGLKKVLQLTIAGCLGPCDLTNVVRISGAAEEIWLGRVDRFGFIQTWEWASRRGSTGTLLPLPEYCDALRFSRFGEKHETIHPESLRV